MYTCREEGGAALNSSDTHNDPNSTSEQEQYYRLVPVEESRAYEYSTISFSDFIRHYWGKRKILYWSVAVFLIIGIFFALFSPEEYTAETTITAEYELQDQASEIIESYSMLFGLTGNVRKLRNPSYLLEQYPALIASTSFQLDLMQQPFTYSRSDSTITMYDYFIDIHRPPLTQLLHQYTVGFLTSSGSSARNQDLPSALQLPSDSIQNVADTSGAQFPILELNSETMRVRNELSSRITATYLRPAGIVRIQTEMPDPELAAVLAQLTLNVLHDNLRHYKNEKSRLHMEYLEIQQEQAGEELEEARNALVSSAADGEQSFNERLELQSNYEASLNRLNSITEQINRVQADTRNQLPVFRIVDDITVPNQKSGPDRILIIILSLLAGIFLAICWITIRFFFARLK